jgi:hypothetical protein
VEPRHVEHVKQGSKSNWAEASGFLHNTGGDETDYLCSGVCAGPEQVVKITTRSLALIAFALFGKTFHLANPPLPA